MDNYQVTSDEQRQTMSKVIAGPSAIKPKTIVMNNEKEVIIAHSEGPKSCPVRVCTCQSNENDVSNIISEILDATKCKGKTTIKLEIEISNE